MATTVVEHIRRMRGGAQSHLMRCADGFYYVVKFRNNPQHVRVLANELLATRLAAIIGLPVPVAALVEVTPELIGRTRALTIVLGNTEVSVEAGLHFGSRYAVSPNEGQVLDYLPPDQLGRVRNLQIFAGALAFDKWTGNADGRQVAFSRKLRERKYSATLIDQGYCFNAGEWTFSDFPLRGVYPRNEVYTTVTGWSSFEPWLTRIETLEDDLIWAAAGEVPPEWYSSSWSELETLIQTLIRRKVMVRDLILEFGRSHRRPFSSWTLDMPRGAEKGASGPMSLGCCCELQPLTQGGRC